MASWEEAVVFADMLENRPRGSCRTAGAHRQHSRQPKPKGNTTPLRVSFPWRLDAKLTASSGPGSVQAIRHEQVHFPASTDVISNRCDVLVRPSPLVADPWDCGRPHGAHRRLSGCRHGHAGRDNRLGERLAMLPLRPARDAGLPHGLPAVVDLHGKIFSERLDSHFRADGAGLGSRSCQRLVWY